MPINATLTCTSKGEWLEVTPSGVWTAVQSAALEDSVTAVAPQVFTARKLSLNMAGIRELDTLGAWLLERICPPGLSASPARHAELRAAHRPIAACGAEAPDDASEDVDMQASALSLTLAAVADTRLEEKNPSANYGNLNQTPERRDALRERRRQRRVSALRGRA